MSKLNIFVSLHAYEDAVPSNSPAKNHFRWAASAMAVPVGDPGSWRVTLAPGESSALFSGTRTLAHDGTTQYSLSPKAGSLGTYVLSHAGGTAPAFRAARTTGADATTVAALTKNGPVMTLSSTGGTAFSFVAGGAVVGDKVRLGTGFSAANRGEYTVLARTATSLQFENESGVAEAGVVLGADFATDAMAYSSAGVQDGDKVSISGGFSPASRRTYEVTDVAAGYVEFFSADSLPEELSVTTDAVEVYSSAKRLVYVESSSEVTAVLNGASTTVAPPAPGSSPCPAMLLSTSPTWELSVSNPGTEAAEVLVLAVE